MSLVHYHPATFFLSASSSPSINSPSLPSSFLYSSKLYLTIRYNTKPRPPTITTAKMALPVITMPHFQTSFINTTSHLSPIEFASYVALTATGVFFTLLLIINILCVIVHGIVEYVHRYVREFSEEQHGLLDKWEEKGYGGLEA
jgi:hypothetical protein